MVPNTAAQAVPAPFKLPVQIVTPADISRLVREIDEIEAFFEESSLKAATTKTIPQASQQLTALMNENTLNIVHKNDRAMLALFLKHLRLKAPLVHISFATDPKPDFLMKLVLWFRSNAHPHVLVQIGLQPNIAAGCVLRTTNKYFDFSFKQHFEQSKAKLSAALRANT